MGLFDLVGSVLIAPLKVAETAVRTTVKTAEGVVTLDPDKVGRAAKDAVEELAETVEDIGDSIDR